MRQQVLKARKSRRTELFYSQRAEAHKICWFLTYIMPNPQK